jgi:hypothetical protein
MGKVAAALVVGVFAVGALVWYAPWLTEQRTVITSTPSLQGISTLGEVKVPGKGRACVRPLPLDPNVREVQMLLNTRGHGSPAVDLTMTGPGGYRATARFNNYVPGSATVVTARLSEAPQQTGDGQLCLRNTGRRAIGLVGTGEAESVTLPVTYVGDKPPGEIDPAITFLAGGHRSFVQHAGTILDRAAGFTGVIPGWAMWPLVLLFLAALPLGAAAALLLASRTD